uniref:Uncharacterized protein n=1 Tax=Panagrolaimus superbus TaxID=310955 RepID=A0A914YNF5_9BILA
MAPKRIQILTESKAGKAALRKLAAERERKKAKSDPQLALALEEKKRRKAEAERRRYNLSRSQVAELERQKNRRDNNGLRQIYIDESSQSQVLSNTSKQQRRRSDPVNYNRDLQLKRLQNQRRSLGSVSSNISNSSGQNSVSQATAQSAKSVENSQAGSFHTSDENSTRTQVTTRSSESEQGKNI